MMYMLWIMLFLIVVIGGCGIMMLCGLSILFLLGKLLDYILKKRWVVPVIICLFILSWIFFVCCGSRDIKLSFLAWVLVVTLVGIALLCYKYVITASLEDYNVKKDAVIKESASELEKKYIELGDKTVEEDKDVLEIRNDEEVLYKSFDEKVLDKSFDEKVWIKSSKVIKNKDDIIIEIFNDVCLENMEKIRVLVDENILIREKRVRKDNREKFNQLMMLFGDNAFEKLMNNEVTKKKLLMFINDACLIEKEKLTKEEKDRLIKLGFLVSYKSFMEELSRKIQKEKLKIIIEEVNLFKKEKLSEQKEERERLESLGLVVNDEIFVNSASLNLEEERIRKIVSDMCFVIPEQVEKIINCVSSGSGLGVMQHIKRIVDSLFNNNDKLKRKVNDSGKDKDKDIKLEKKVSTLNKKQNIIENKNILNREYIRSGSYVIEFRDEDEFRKRERALKKYNMLAYKKLIFEYYPNFREGKFTGVMVKKDDLGGYENFELKLPTDSMFAKVYGDILLHYTVYYNQRIVMLETITPKDVLMEASERKELSTYKGVPISKSHAEKDMFKINLLNMLDIDRK